MLDKAQGGISPKAKPSFQPISSSHILGIWESCGQWKISHGTDCIIWWKSQVEGCRSLLVPPTTHCQLSARHAHLPPTYPTSSSWHLGLSAGRCWLPHKVRGGESAEIWMRFLINFSSLSNFKWLTTETEELFESFKGWVKGESTLSIGLTWYLRSQSRSELLTDCICWGVVKIVCRRRIINSDKFFGVWNQIVKFLFGELTPIYWK